MICRLLLLMHTDQLVRVRWNGILSDDFNVSNGVKQGGILSPILFSLYIDHLLVRIRNSKIGCHVGNIFVGAIGYADDITLLCPTLSGLRKMLKIAEASVSDLQLSFNPGKCQLLRFDSISRTADDGLFSVNFCGINVMNCSSAVHIGHYIGQDSSARKVSYSVADFYRRCNALLYNFSSCSSRVKLCLLSAYCMSIYGSSLWNFSNKSCDSLFVCWRICVRRVLNVPYRAHSNLLHFISNCLPIDVQLYNRLLKFINSTLISENSLVQLCNKLIVNGSSSSAVSNSISHICNRYKLSRYHLPTSVSHVDIIPECVKTAVEFIHLRDNSSDKETKLIAQDIVNYCTTL